MNDSLDREMFEEVCKVLLHVFTSPREIDELLQFSLNVKLQEISSPTANLSDSIFKVVEWSQAQGRLEELVNAALKVNPGNRRLLQLAGRLLPRVDPIDYLFDYLKHLSGSSTARVDPVADLLQQLQRAWQRQLEDDTATLDQMRQRLAAAEDAYAEHRNTQQTLETAQQRLAAMETQNTQLTQTVSTLRQQLKEREADLAAATAHLAEIEAQTAAIANTPATAPLPYPDTLTAAQHRRGHEVILAAFPKKAELVLLTREALDMNLATISSEADLSSVVAELVGWAEARGKLPVLLAGMATENPGNKALQAWLASLRPVAE